MTAAGRPLRCLIDAMIFDLVASEPERLEAVDRLTRAGRLELLAAAGTMSEIAVTPDPEHRRRLRRVRVLVVPPADPADFVSQDLLEDLERFPGVSEPDARVAVAAFGRGVALATEDRDLQLAVAARLPEVPVWRWATELEPRIAALPEASR